eukprot:11615969-Alexandrium_andersonii.AAC.1
MLDREGRRDRSTLPRPSWAALRNCKSSGRLAGSAFAALAAWARRPWNTCKLRRRRWLGQSRWMDSLPAVATCPPQSPAAPSGKRPA